MLNLSYLNPFHGILQDFPQNEGRKTSTDSVELGGMTKNLYHGIFLNYTGFTVYDGIFIFMHARVLTTFSTDWGKTAVDWLTMPYFSVIMSEYCRKSPH